MLEIGEDAVLDSTELASRSAGFLRPDSLKAAALVRPANTKQVSKVVRWCHDNDIAVVPHGGLTGLVHGADAQPDEVILSLERMRAIEQIDPVQRTATVRAGVALQALQEAARGNREKTLANVHCRGCRMRRATRWSRRAILTPWPRPLNEAANSLFECQTAVMVRARILAARFRARAVACITLEY